MIEADAIFFDHDGLLVETEWLFFDVTRALFRQEGIELSEDLWSTEYLGKGRGSSFIAAELGLAADRIEAVLPERNRRYCALLELEPPLCPFVREVLTTLKRQFPIGLVTGNTRSAVETVHRRTGVLEQFDLVVTQEDFERAKPMPDAYLVAAERLGVAPARCVAVEDSERGMAAALAAGMRCIAVPGVLTKRQVFRGAHAVLPSLESLPSLVSPRRTS